MVPKKRGKKKGGGPVRTYDTGTYVCASSTCAFGVHYSLKKSEGFSCWGKLLSQQRAVFLTPTRVFRDKLHGGTTVKWSTVCSIYTTKPVRAPSCHLQRGATPPDSKWPHNHATLFFCTSSAKPPALLRLLTVHTYTVRAYHNPPPGNPQNRR